MQKKDGGRVYERTKSDDRDSDEVSISLISRKTLSGY